MAHPDHSATDGSPALHGHQHDQVQIGTIFWFGVGLTISVTIVFIVIWFLLLFFRGRDLRTAEDRPPLFDIRDGLYPPPRLQEHEEENLKSYRAEIAKKVESYRWVDQKAGIAQIPISRAMEIMAESKQLKSRSSEGVQAEEPKAVEAPKNEQPAAPGATP
jgi:hypothetical protein